MYGRLNQSRGKAFEQWCAGRAEQLGLDLMIKHVKRDQYTSAVDLEFIDFPQYRVDCKFTETHFTVAETKKLLADCQSKYCADGDIPIIIKGERREKTRLDFTSIQVVTYLRKSPTPLIIMIPYDDWLHHLHDTKQVLLQRR